MMNDNDIKKLVEQEIKQLKNKGLLASLKPFLIPLKSKAMIWEWEGKKENYTAWVFADLQERNVGIAYAEGGFASKGAPWGLIFLDKETSGEDYFWYKTLEECLDDSGYFC